jgi:alkanesulfonate monooxygenase SsuD/methylene tetrahydromethanopterin reductase-like flavin-dependent oxidoreductase (luciferase family)
MPPVLVGGTEKAFDRILRVSAGWLPSQLSPADLAAAAERLRSRAREQGLSRPPITVGGHLILGEGPSVQEAYETLVRQLVEEHGVPEEEAARSPMRARTPEELAELYSAYAEAGADRVIAGADNLGWEEQLDFIGQARALLPG